MEFLIQFTNKRNGNIQEEKVNSKKVESIKSTSELLLTHLSSLMESKNADKWRNRKCLIRLIFETLKKITPKMKLKYLN